MFDTKGVRDIRDWYVISGISEDIDINKFVGINGVVNINDVAGVAFVDYILRVLNKVLFNYLINQVGSLIF